MGGESARSACVFNEILRHHVDVELFVDLDCDLISFTKRKAG